MNEDRLKIIEQQLVELEQQKSELLIEQRALLDSNASSTATARHSEALSTDQKVRLFMSLFKGDHLHRLLLYICLPIYNNV